jgi:hypothetical protein
VPSQEQEAVIRERALAVVGWWDRLDAMDSDDEIEVADVTSEMEKRINALREALEL